MPRPILAIVLLAPLLLVPACRSNSPSQGLADPETRQYNDRGTVAARLEGMDARIENLEREMGDLRQSVGLLPPRAGKKGPPSTAQRAPSGKVTIAETPALVPPPPAPSAETAPAPVASAPVAPASPAPAGPTTPATAATAPPAAKSLSAPPPDAPASDDGSRAASLQDTSPPAPATAGERRGSSAKSGYDSALALYYKGQYDKSEQAFSAFLKAHPQSPLAPNALYWKGECLYSREKFDQAILAFKDVAGKYPKHDKAAAALLKAGYAYAEIGDMGNARFYWQLLVDDYPASAPAGLARQRLGKK